MIKLTGNCRICKSIHAQVVTAMIIEGHLYSEIIQKFPDLRLNKPLITRHRRHFVNPCIVERAAVEASDHGFIDRLRNLGLVYIGKGEGGADLTYSQTQIIQAAMRGVLGRKQLEDPQEQISAVYEMIERASKAAWKHADASTPSDSGAAKGVCV